LRLSREAILGLHILANPLNLLAFAAGLGAEQVAGCAPQQPRRISSFERDIATIFI
jgi:hypothetical protein